MLHYQFTRIAFGKGQFKMTVPVGQSPFLRMAFVDSGVDQAFSGLLVGNVTRYRNLGLKGKGKN